MIMLLSSTPVKRKMTFIAVSKKVYNIFKLEGIIIFNNN